MEITIASKEGVTLQTANKHCKENISVKVQTRELNITPSTTDQVKEGLYNKVTVFGDENLVSENIVKGKTIFGVEGTSIPSWDTSQIRRAERLFYYNTEMTEAPYLNTINVESSQEMFSHCSALIKALEYNLKNTTSMNNMYTNCDELIEVPNINSEKCKQYGNMFYQCRKLKTIGTINAESAIGIFYILRYCNALENFGGLINLGKAFNSSSVNYNQYGLDLRDCKLLTHESLMNIINNLYDLNITYDVANGGTLATQQLNLTDVNIVKLTAEEIAIATNKGWTVS